MITTLPLRHTERKRTIVGRFFRGLKKCVRLIRIFFWLNCGASEPDIIAYIDCLRVGSFTLKWIIFWDTLHSFNRCAELKRLIRCARRRRFKNPANAYCRRLHREGSKLSGRKIRYPRVYFCSRLLFLFGRLISRAPRYHAKGSASAYRSR